MEPIAAGRAPNKACSQKILYEPTGGGPGMPGTLDKVLQVDLEKLNADIAASLEKLRALLDDCNVLATSLSRLRALMEKHLREGWEGNSLAVTLKSVLFALEHARELYSHALVVFKDEDSKTNVLRKQLAEAVDFARWVNQLLARLAAPRPPIDESRLPNPGAVEPGQAPGFVSIDDA